MHFLLIFYVGWWDYGLSVVLTDDVSTALEIFPPSTIATARGIRVGSTVQELEASLGQPDSVFGERNAGYEAWTYEAAGSSYYIDSSSTVSSISLWSP